MSSTLEAFVFMGKNFSENLHSMKNTEDLNRISAKDQSRIHQFGKKVLPGLFLRYALYAGGIWKGDVLVADP